MAKSAKVSKVEALQEEVQALRNQLMNALQHMDGHLHELVLYATVDAKAKGYDLEAEQEKMKLENAKVMEEAAKEFEAKEKAKKEVETEVIEVKTGK